MNRRLLLSLIIGLTVLLSACTDDVLVFPTPEPANVKIVNTTQDVSVLETVIDASTSMALTFGGTPSSTPWVGARM
jgi:hypothetical protein